MFLRSVRSRHKFSMTGIADHSIVTRVICTLLKMSVRRDGKEIFSLKGAIFSKTAGDAIDTTCKDVNRSTIEILSSGRRRVVEFLSSQINLMLSSADGVISQTAQTRRSAARLVSIAKGNIFAGQVAVKGAKVKTRTIDCKWGFAFKVRASKCRM